MPVNTIMGDSIHKSFKKESLSKFLKYTIITVTDRVQGKSFW